MKINTSEGLIFEGKRNETILESAKKNNIIFEYSCSTGQCGVCRTKLLSGQVKELKSQLALNEEDIRLNYVLTCCVSPACEILIDAKNNYFLKGIENKILPAKINSKVKHTDDILEVELRLPPTSTFNFIEGQYIDVSYNGIKRSYSIASCSSKTTITLYIKKYNNGKMSNYWFNQAKVNDLLKIEGPKGTFFIRDKNAKLIFLATGTGIAPIKAILEDLDSGLDIKKDIMVFWGNRYETDFFWKPNFKNLSLTLFNTCSKPSTLWNGNTDYVQNLLLKNINNFEGVEVYACGSNSMISSAKKILIENGLSPKQFYSDAFVKSF